MRIKTTIGFAALALISLAEAPSAFADIPAPMDCTGMKAGAGCVTQGSDTGICVEQNGSLVCEIVCNGPSGSGCCDVTTNCCGTNAYNGVCKSVTGGYACDSTDSQVCNGQSKGAPCKTGAGEAGTCEMTGDSSCSFLTCTRAATSGSSSSGGGTTSGVGGGTSGGTNSSGGCAIEALPRGPSLGMSFLAAALGATALRRRRSAK